MIFNIAIAPPFATLTIVLLNIHKLRLAFNYLINMSSLFIMYHNRNPTNDPTIIERENTIKGSPTNTVRKNGFAIFLFLTS